MSPGKFFVLWKLYWLSLSHSLPLYSRSIVKIFSGTITDATWFFSFTFSLTKVFLGGYREVCSCFYPILKVNKTHKSFGTTSLMKGQRLKESPSILIDKKNCICGKTWYFHPHSGRETKNTFIVCALMLQKYLQSQTSFFAQLMHSAFTEFRDGHTVRGHSLSAHAGLRGVFSSKCVQMRA